MTFTVEVFQNEYLAEGASKVDAIAKVTATGGPKLTTAAEKAVVLAVDVSGSMHTPRSKILSARKSAATALQLLPDGTLFALVAGNHFAQCVYPRSGQLCRANPETRAEAVHAATRLDAGGGTAISTWIDEVRQLVEPHEDAIRLAYLLTDGKNESERPEVLEEALTRAAGSFQCDARGVGPDWAVDELRRISSALLGDVNRIAEPSEMEADFREFMNRAIGKTIPDVRLRVWTPKGATIDLLSQVAPTIDDLTAKGEFVPPLSCDFPTGAWAGQETRDYHLRVDVPPGEIGDEKLAGRVTLLVGDDVVGQGLVKAIWTEDRELSTRIDREVAHYTNQEQLAEYVDEGFEALKKGDDDTATAKFQRVVELAQETGREELLEAISGVVDLDGPTVRIRPGWTNDSKNEVVVVTGRTRPIERLQPGGGGPGAAGTP